MKRLLLIALLVVLLPACRFASDPPPAATPTATTAPPDPTATRPADPTTSSPATAAAPPPAADGPLFDIDPSDRSVFAAGLTAAEADVLDGLPGAPVYHMAIAIDASLSRLSGRQTVTYTNLEDVDLAEVYFHLHANTLEGDITVSDVAVDGVPVEPSPAGGDILRVPLPSPLAPGEAVAIDMAFETTVPTEIGRNYGVLAYYEDILALAHFYPMLSVYDDEGWNTTAPDTQGDLTYSDAAFYVVRVTAPEDVVLVGAGTVVAQETGGGTQTVTFVLGPARDFYLAAGDFDVVSETVGETSINSYAPAKFARGAAIALDTAAYALREHAARLSPFPYTELDIVTTPTSALGIEYPGLIVGTLQMYDVDADSATGLPNSAILESTTAHEVGHQWFYNLVGSDQLDEPWLDESVVSYSTYRYFADRYGQTVGDNYFQFFYGRWDRVGGEEIPIGMPVAAYEGAEYGAIVYGRGAIFVRELEEAMGREAFDAFLQSYFRQYRWEEGTTEAFRALAEAQCGCDLGPLFEEWVYP